jgi:hypothetical protein
MFLRLGPCVAPDALLHRAAGGNRKDSELGFGFVVSSAVRLFPQDLPDLFAKNAGQEEA